MRRIYILLVTLCLFFNVVISSYNCSQNEYGCCPDENHPAHGPKNLGCCSYSTYGCCPDDYHDAGGSHNENCDCKSYEFGCCPDGITPAIGLSYEGCGCMYSSYGCCPDQVTEALDSNLEKGCHCSTFEFGCCPDGITRAKGYNLEGCVSCNSEFGCCEDGITPRLNNQPCLCESSEFGCCLDGVEKASGPNFKGCERLPGTLCKGPAVPGNCSDFQIKWYFDAQWGGCNKFWYGGCYPGSNHFDEEEECKNECVTPRGSAVCYLEKNVGSCKADYEEYYYDMNLQRCSPFVYGGCLGNGNRFSNLEACQRLCESKGKEPLCSKPMAEGSCLGNYTRWYFDGESGDCNVFSYTGCGGNNNRFMSQEECSHTCAKFAANIRTKATCSLSIDTGDCSENLLSPKWGYDDRLHRCTPFYYSGCNGNANNFESNEECELICPTSFPPNIDLRLGDEILLKRNSAPGTILPVSIRSNPPATVEWYFKGHLLDMKNDLRYSMLSDFSLKLNQNIKDSDHGVYVLKASNGIGDPVVKNINVIVYPLYLSVEIPLDKSIFPPKSELVIPCKIQGYPTPVISWYKVIRGDSIPIKSDRSRVYIETVSLSTFNLTSILRISNLKESDSGIYKCEASSEGASSTYEQVSISVQFGPGERCEDRPSYKHCHRVLKYRLCENKYYGQYCCQSCVLAGYLPGGLKK